MLRTLSSRCMQMRLLRRAFCTDNNEQFRKLMERKTVVSKSSKKLPNPLFYFPAVTEYYPVTVAWTKYFSLGFVVVAGIVYAGLGPLVGVPTAILALLRVIKNHKIKKTLGAYVSKVEFINEQKLRIILANRTLYQVEISSLDIQSAMVQPGVYYTSIGNIVPTKRVSLVVMDRLPCLIGNSQVFYQLVTKKKDNFSGWEITNQSFDALKGISAVDKATPKFFQATSKQPKSIIATHIQQMVLYSHKARVKVDEIKTKAALQMLNQQDKPKQVPKLTTKQTPKQNSKENPKQ